MATSGVRVPPPTVKPVTAFVPDSTTQRVRPSGESRASSAPAPIWPAPVLWRNARLPSAPNEQLETDAEGGLTTKRKRPSWLISTQQDAPPSLATGGPTGVRVPSAPSRKLETRPGKAAPPPAVWASETNSWFGLVGLNSAPSWPYPCAGENDCAS